MLKSSFIHSALMLQIESVSALSEADRQAIEQLPLRSAEFAQGRDILGWGKDSVDCCIIQRGVAARYAIVGGKRQLQSVHFAGDMPDLQRLVVDRLDYGVSAVTPVKVAYVPINALRHACETSPGLSKALQRHAVVDGAISRAWLTGMGRKTALERIAHLLAEFYLRLRAIGLADRYTIDLPLTQTDYADITGLSTVHINRSFQELRRRGILGKSSRARITIENWDELCAIGQFNPAYLALRDMDQLANRARIID